MRIVQFVGVLLIAFLISAGTLFNIYGDWLWFSSVGYPQVFLTLLFGSFMLGALTGLGFLGFSFLNLYVARKRSVKGKKKPRDGFLFWIAGFFALMVGSGFSNWEVWLKFLNPSEFAGTDPVFGLNTGFYVFTMPFYGFLLTYFIVTIVLTALLTLASYAVNAGVRKESEELSEASEGGFPGREFEMPSFSLNLTAIKKRLTPHLSVLLGLLLLAVSFGMVLAQWGLLYSENGAVFGAAYTDLSVTLYVYTLLFIVSLVVAVLFFLNARIRRWRLILEGIAALVIIAFVGFLASGITQAFIVAPDEFNVESPYIERNIMHTLEAYDLGDIREQIFPVEYDLTQQDIQANPGTIDNIRLWDWRPLTKTYNQLQLFRTYYDFNDVDIDRYALDGSYKQIMVSAREMNTEDLSSNARTWVNEHLVYTHGYGMVMNPVDMVTPEGLPEFYVQDIPPEADFANLEVERPEIYYGEDTWNYVVSRTTTEEFDYPSGEQNIYTTYEGGSGVPLADALSRLTYAVKFGSIELLVSNSITQDSKILLYRDIRSRLGKLAPFLRFDPDPYIVVSGGRLYWIADAYTVTDMYPYSQPIYAQNIGVFNYIRNSVKVVVDAYTGEVSFYVIDREDPVIQTWMKIFPEMFREFSDMPEDLQSHIRYPEELFSIQSSIYSVYHMKDPRVFYNKEDVWVIPDEIYRGSRQEITPYYVIIHLPGEEREEFVMMIPFNPRGKENLIGWMAARCDQPGYGGKLVYQFSKQELVYGPMQIEARIDQDTDISQLFTLWGQAGSAVLRGNTLVIPVENSILYIEPVYLEATERGTLPELKRVIVAYGNRLTMQETLEDALSVIFGQAPTGPGPAPGETPDEVLAQIAELYEKAQQALGDNNLGLYQQYINQIGDLVSTYE
jgi:uncharacterized membrane protein (UPF0182 family)